MLSQLFIKMWQEAEDHNRDNILSLLDIDPKAKVVDIGCGDGRVTIRYKRKIQCEEITGIDGVRRRLNAAKKNGVNRTIFADLEERWPLKDGSFDVVISNQVIEHILNVDHFIKEIYRILRPGGYCVISTENLSSWHNIFALVAGFQDFSHTILKKKHVGNPLSVNFGKKTHTWDPENRGDGDDSRYPHIRILTYKSLIDVFKEFGFRFERGAGSGYYPLLGSLSFLVSKIDPSHSHFITVRMSKSHHVNK